MRFFLCLFLTFVAWAAWPDVAATARDDSGIALAVLIALALAMIIDIKEILS